MFTVYRTTKTVTDSQSFTMADQTELFEIELHEGDLCEEEDDDIIDIIDDVSRLLLLHKQLFCIIQERRDSNKRNDPFFLPTTNSQ